MREVTHVTRYVATYVNKDGMRTLMTAAQGRFTWATMKEAEDWIKAVTLNNSQETLEQVWGKGCRPTFQARECQCYAGHFDPVRVWFD